MPVGSVPHSAPLTLGVLGRFPKSTVGVFFCGPSVMSKLLYEKCRAHSNEAFTVFKYHKENF